MDNSNNQSQPNFQDPSANNATTPPPPSNPEPTTPSWPITPTQTPPVFPAPLQSPASTPPWSHPVDSVNPSAAPATPSSWAIAPQPLPTQPISAWPPSTQPEQTPNPQTPPIIPSSLSSFQENLSPVTPNNPLTEIPPTTLSGLNLDSTAVSNPIDQSSQYVDPNTVAAGNSQPPSLDNPYNTPLHPPSIDSASSTSQNPYHQSAWSPSTAQTTTNPIVNSPSDTITPQDSITSNPSDQAPTDLSHLISNSDTSNSESPVIPQTEAVASPIVNATPEVPAIPTEHKGGIPKWVIGLGVGLLILIAGASAYFILGVGQTPKNTSLPATEAPEVNQQVNNAPASPTPQEPVSPPIASGSSNFGELQGSGSAPQASSAADILKARQQQQGR